MDGLGGSQRDIKSFGFMGNHRNFQELEDDLHSLLEWSEICPVGLEPSRNRLSKKPKPSRGRQPSKEAQKRNP
ncbi:hypothetical protein G4B88_021256 [Cannabis sativa]|uniref:Uncharacterized protein n=1 Tax=Cannabis sativa TaxID=3483 RepID=A0A7J6HXQ0_CANSA|nr:hypothetical protein G4B88_021256 [Cannabis sativa]